MGRPLLLHVGYEDDGVDGYFCCACKHGYSARYVALKFCPHCGIEYTESRDVEEIRYQRAMARQAEPRTVPMVWEVQFTERHQHPEWSNDDYLGWMTARRLRPGTTARQALAYGRAFVRAWDLNQRRSHDPCGESDPADESYKDDHFYSIVKTRLVRVREDAAKVESPRNEYYGFYSHEIPFNVRCLSRNLIDEEMKKLEGV